MYEIVGYRPIKTKKGDDAYIVAYVKPMRAGTVGYGMEAGEQFVTKSMMDGAFAGVAPDKVVGQHCVFVYNQTGFLEGLTVTPSK